MLYISQIVREDTMQNQIENGKLTLAIADGSVQSPDFLEKIEKESEGAKLTYYLWLSRFFITTTIFSLLLLVSSALALFRLSPMVSVEPFLIINQDSSEEIVRSEALVRDLSSKEKLMEMFVRQYVILRNTIINDPAEMRSRWYGGGMVHYLSSQEVFIPFYTNTSKNWVEMFQQALVREVEIISVGRQGGKKSPIWKVDFKTYDLYDESKGAGEANESILRVRYWTASVTAHFIKDRLFIGRRLINPLGFTVTRYSQTEVEIF